MTGKYIEGGFDASDWLSSVLTSCRSAEINRLKSPSSERIFANTMGSLSRRLRETLVSYHSLNETEWNIAKKSKDVTVWRKPSEEFSGFLYKAEGTVADNPRRIIEFMIPGPRRMEWDSLMTSLEIVETLDEGCCVVKYSTAGQLWNIISPREFVDFSYTCDYQRGLLSCGVSVEHSEQTPGLVRGFNHPCGWFCVPTEDPAVSVLTGFIQTDLKGMIPQSAVDSAMAAGLVRFYRELTHALAAEPP